MLQDGSCAKFNCILRLRQFKQIWYVIVKILIKSKSGKHTGPNVPIIDFDVGITLQCRFSFWIP